NRAGRPNPIRTQARETSVPHLPPLQRQIRQAPQILRRMRQAHESGDRMRTVILLFAALPIHAAVTGTVTNQTTGKPQPRATVGLYKLGAQTGLELMAQAK